MKRIAIVTAAIGALAAAFAAVPANAFPAAATAAISHETASAIQTVGYRGGHGGFSRGHGRGLRIFLGGRRHGGGYADGGAHRRNYGWAYGRRGHGGGHGDGGYGRRH